MKKVCKKYKICYVKNAENILDNKDLIYWDENDANSGFHPSTLGGKKMATKIAEYLLYDKIE